MKKNSIIIRETQCKDIGDILNVESIAFGNEKEAELVKDLLEDPSAQPVLSLLAFDNENAIGHILFTKTSLKSKNSINTTILAPLAVIPEFQNQGVGGMLIEEGLKRLSKSGVEIVFVLGHPRYYPRYGFSPAGCQGFEAPYHIPEEHAGAWMLQTLGDYTIGENVFEKVVCAVALDKPEYWRE
ncbi:MAG: N-acetyltransferase [Proteobacteria bacterium]|nr:N-acetyltransferase [Pseudomonadota bacterium]